MTFNLKKMADNQQKEKKNYRLNLLYVKLDVKFNSSQILLCHNKQFMQKQKKRSKKFEIIKKKNHSKHQSLQTNKKKCNHKEHTFIYNSSKVKQHSKL